jgi:hypothetical protein
MHPAVQEFAEGIWRKRTNEVAGGRKPAQPSIPEGILGFPPPDTHTHGTPAAILKSLKTHGIALA